MPDSLRDSDITLAVVHSKLESVGELVEKIDEKLDKHADRITTLETSLKWMVCIGGGVCTFCGAAIYWVWDKVTG